MYPVFGDRGLFERALILDRVTAIHIHVKVNARVTRIEVRRGEHSVEKGSRKGAIVQFRGEVQPALRPAAFIQFSFSRLLAAGFKSRGERPAPRRARGPFTRVRSYHRTPKGAG